MTVTLDDVASLLHIPIDSMLLFGSDTGDALIEVDKTKCAHCRFSYLEKIFKERLKEQRDLAAEYGETEEVERLRDQVVRIYLLYLVGITIFTNKSQWDVDVVYLKFFRDLDLVSSFSSEVVALAHLYKELNNAARWNCSQVAGYLTLLQT
ncbi:protein MAIN-LIKE 2-like [Medicago truncatula]|uniref:protein MAIN-LIKE 2-like n=1 Tax=Medicago truncatula TaxID=3880 RepID=UPI001966EB9D|nr:protein MAIN-LIKE 2-like [Medicago truncatula]